MARRVDWSSLGNPATLAAAIGVLALAVYGASLYPDVAGGDSGELAVAVARWGVIHPPGYPLYALAGRLFAVLPFGTVAWRLGLLSAACDSAAAAIFFLAVTRLSGSRAAGAVTAALFAFSPLVWRYAICAEVFAMNNLACAALLLLAASYERSAEPRFAILTALVAGLGFADHHTVVFAALPCAVWIAWRGRGLGVRSGLGCALALLVGLLPYGYLPWAARHGAPVSWGEADTWTGFWTHVLRRDYGTFRLAASGVAGVATGPSIALAWARELFDQFGGWGVALAVVGAAASVSACRHRPILLLPIAVPVFSVAAFAWLGNLPVTDALHREIVSRFWQEPNAFVFVTCGVGVAEIGRRVPRWAPAALAGALLALLPSVRFASMTRRGDTVVRSYGAEILRAAPQDALLLTRGDLITNTVRYLQAVDGLRPDLRVVDLELLGYPWYARRLRGVVLPGPRYAPGAPDGFAIADLLDVNIDRGPVLECGGIKPGDTSAAARYGAWPWGLCSAMRRGGEPVNVQRWIAESEAALPRVDFPRRPRPAGSWEDVVWEDYWEVRQARAVHLLDLAGPDPARRPFIGVAAEILEAIVAQNPEVPGHVYRNLAIALGRRGIETAEDRARAAAAWRKYLETAPPGDPYTLAVQKELSRLTAP